MDRLDAMRVFVRVVETRSFSATAREVGVGQSAVSKQIAALEGHLAVQLLHRTSRSLRLTEAGQVFYDEAVRLLNDLDNIESSVRRGQLQPAGLLRVTLSAGFGRLQIVPLLPAFKARYPDITLDLVVSDRFVDLVEEGIDVAIRLGELADSRLLARSIGMSPRVTVAARTYLDRAGEPRHPHDLDGHDCVAFTFQQRPNPWVFQTRDGTIRHVPRGAVRANDAEHIRAVVLAGLGIAQVPRWLFSKDLAAGDVREILSDFPSGRVPIHAVFPAGRKAPGKVRVFVDHIAEAFAADPDLT